MPTIEELIANFEKVQNEEYGTKAIYHPSTMEKVFGKSENDMYPSPNVFRGGFMYDPGYTEYKIDPNWGRLLEEGKKTSEGMREELARRENVARTDLVNRRNQVNASIESQLQKLLEESGIEGREARAQTGATYAGANLGRSTQAASAIQDVAQQELAQKAQYRQAALDQTQKANYLVEDSLRQIEQNKEARAIRFSLANIKNAAEFQANVRADDIKQEYMRTLADMELNQREYENQVGLFGSIAKGIASIFAGGF